MKPFDETETFNQPIHICTKKDSNEVTMQSNCQWPAWLYDPHELYIQCRALKPHKPSPRGSIMKTVLQLCFDISLGIIRTIKYATIRYTCGPFHKVQMMNPFLLSQQTLKYASHVVVYNATARLQNYSFGRLLVAMQIVILQGSWARCSNF